jgi:MFS family permease
MRRLPAVLIAVAAGLVLADAAIVALALPPLLDELDTTVTGVAAVVGVYALVLALGIHPAARLARRWGAGPVGAAGLALFAAASLGCAVSDDLTTLLAFRALAALGGAAGLIAAFDLLGAGGEDGSLGRRLWVGVAVFGTAAGPALGGVLTELLDWRAIFLVQAPVAAAAAIGCRPSRAPEVVGAEPSEPLRWRPALALGAVSAALVALVFLLVLELVAGWSVDPLEAAAAVSVLPVAAVVASRIPGDVRVRAVCGCLLVAVGATGLAFLPDASVGWTAVPQLVAGAGLGMALPALAGGLLPERSAPDAARLLVVRHVGIVAALVLLAPILADELRSVAQSARREGTGVLLRASIDPLTKLEIAPALLDGVDGPDPRAGLRDALTAQRDAVAADDQVAYATMAEDLDTVVVDAVVDAFRPAYLITAGLAGMAGLVLLGAGPAPPRPLGRGSSAG